MVNRENTFLVTKTKKEKKLVGEELTLKKIIKNNKASSKPNYNNNLSKKHEPTLRELVMLLITDVSEIKDIIKRNKLDGILERNNLQ
jgi:hypothetical protein